MKLRFPLILGTCILTLSACTPSADTQNDSDAVDTGTTTGAAMMAEPENGVTMKGGVMLTIKDGRMSRMDKDVTYEDGTTVKMDGIVTLADGTQLMLPEGMMVTTEGQLQMSESAAAPSPAAAGSASTAAMSSTTYAAYSDAVLKDGKTKVLFFAAAWCPVCTKQSAVLETWFPSIEFTRSIYKVDYDTAKELKAKYGVVYQHTFVVVDGQGTKISSVQGPTEEQLKALLK